MRIRTCFVAIIILFVVGATCYGQQPDDEQIRRHVQKVMADKRFSIVDEITDGLKRLAERDPQKKKIVFGELSPDPVPAIFYDLKEGRYNEATLKRLTEIVNAAVKASGRVACEKFQPSEPRVHLLKKTSIVSITFGFDGVAVSDKEQKEKMGVTLWICPDRETALYCFWPKQGGNAQWLEQGMERVIDATYHRLWKDFPGERAFYHMAQMMISIALPRDHPRAGGDGIAFLRGNIVVQVNTFSSVLSDKGIWETFGMSKSDKEECLKLLHSIDVALIEESKKARK